MLGRTACWGVLLGASRLARLVACGKKAACASCCVLLGGREQAAFRNTHTYTLYTVAISSHSFVAAQLGFAGTGRCCHGVVAQHCPCEVPREAGGIPCLRRWQISFLPQDPGSCQGSHQTCNQHCQKWAGEYSSAQNQSQGNKKQTGAFKESTTIQDHGTAGDFREIISAVLQIISKTAHVISRTSLTRLAF